MAGARSRRNLHEACQEANERRFSGYNLAANVKGLRMHRPSPAIVTALAAALLVVLAAPATAQDTYRVYSCKGPTGVPNGAAGWSTNPLASGLGKATNSCAAAGPLTALLDSPTPTGDSSASWRFDAPPDTRIVSFAAQRSTTGVVAGTTSADVQYVLDTDQGTQESCAVTDISSCTGDLMGSIGKEGLNAAWVRFRVLCTNAGVGCVHGLKADFNSAVVGLKDAVAPTVSNVAVTDDGDRSGVLALRFDAADRGGGVYRAVTKVDGGVVSATAIGDANCRDANPADADPYQFLSAVPCPASAAALTTRLDYRTLPSGPHNVEVSVEDAAGNATTVQTVQFPRPNIEGTVTVKEVQDRLVNAKVTMYFAKNRKHSYTNRYGRRTVTRGYLRDPKGRGIQGARVDVYHIIQGGKRRLLKTGLKTRRSGRLTLILPLNIDTRRIEYAYRALRPGPITSRTRLNLTVKRNGLTYRRKAKT